MVPHGILFEYGIKDYFIEVNQHECYLKMFFKNTKGDVPFDLFGAAFWLLSRYEEYLPFKTNKYNVFDYRSSLAWQNNFIDLPLVSIWINELSGFLKKQFPDLQLAKKKCSFKVTIDVDNAYKFKHKGLARTLAGIAADIWYWKPTQLKQRFKTLFFNQEDEFDCYDFLIESNRKLRAHIIYFFLLGDYGLNDKNHSANSFKFQQLIKHLSDYSEIGIHPSFASNASINQLKIEIARLKQIIHKEVNNSRQHFGMLLFPNTYQALLASGIQNDYSLGYTNLNGFRASFASPFNWYDLRNEEETSLTLHPFCLNDAALQADFTKNHCEPAETFRKYHELIVRYGGEFVIIFHNDILSNTTQGKKWQQFYQLIISQLPENANDGG